MAACSLIRLVFCSGGNKAYIPIATSVGWHTGARSDALVYPAHRPLYLLDVEWADYDYPAHLAVAMRERPALAAVPDILTPAGLPLALTQAAELAPYCASLLLIPKCRVIEQIPRTIAGTPLVLGYSVPTKYGASPLPLWEYAGWPVHLLGGTPRKQIELAGYMQVVSADGNMAQKLAHRGLCFDGRGHGVPLDRFEPAREGKGMPERALRVSLTHIAALWQRAGYQIAERQKAA